MKLIENIGQLVTLAPLVRQNKLTGLGRDDLGLLAGAWLLWDQGKVLDSGIGKPPPADQRIDADGGLVMPGLVDCHTHPVFGGNRSEEFSQRLDGASYREIAARGGGILSSVTSTRAASQDELVSIGKSHARRFLRHGVTTFEAKSGYGLSCEEELKLLRAIKELSQSSSQTIRATCLALHAVPPGQDKSEYINEVIEQLLPQVKAEDLADYVDAFVEKGYFEPEDCERYFSTARELGFRVRIHADEFQDSRAAEAAAAWHALSADHLEKASDKGVLAMARKGVTAVLLPGTSLYCKIDYADGRRFADAGCPVALATDFNPGSCRIDNLAFIATLGALHCNLNTAEALAAVTYVPARTLELGRSKGHLDKGADADLLIYNDYANIDDWIADLGQKQPRAIYCAGRKCKLD